MAGIKVKGLDKLLAKVKTLEDLEGVKNGLKAGALHMKGKVAKYPPTRRLTRAQVYGQTFQSDRQRRGFFAKLKSGEIDVPYRRGQSSGSQRHGQSWTISSSNKGLRWIVGSDTGYGPLLQDKERQSRYAAAVGWQTVQDVVEEEGRKVQTLIVREVERLLSK